MTVTACVALGVIISLVILAIVVHVNVSRYERDFKIADAALEAAIKKVSNEPGVPEDLIAEISVESIIDEVDE